jgi:hypothetical protein
VPTARAVLDGTPDELRGRAGNASDEARVTRVKPERVAPLEKGGHEGAGCIAHLDAAQVIVRAGAFGDALPSRKPSVHPARSR